MKIRCTACVIVSFFLISLPALAGDSDPTGSQVLERALVALGGEQRLGELSTLEMGAAIEVQGLTGDFTRWTQRPNRSRLDLDLKIIRLTRAYDGTDGWEKKNDSVTSIVGPSLDRIARGARFQPLLDYRLAGVTVELIGREPVGDRVAWVLEIRPADGALERFFIDTESYLPLKEIRMDADGQREGGVEIAYGDYREVDGLMLPFSEVARRAGQTQALTVSEYRVDQLQAEDLYTDPRKAFANQPIEISLGSIPRRVFKENDGVWEDAATESWVFHVVVDEKHGQMVEPTGAVIELFAGGASVKTLHFSAAALTAVSDAAFTGLAQQREIFDLRHHLSEPTALGIDRLVYRLQMLSPEGEKIEKTLEVPLSRYEQKTELIAPVRGNFVVAGGHAFNDDHKGEWSQHYADDILVLGKNYELLNGDGSRNEGHATWGAEIVAPAAGTVIYARNDVPDNEEPGVIDLEALQDLPDPLYAIGGNVVAIDHGSGEISFLAHMMRGSVRVETGDVVAQGQVLGSIGNSGNSDAPHLHYQLMSGPVPFRSDGLPARFENVYLEVFAEKSRAIPMPTPKRGIPVVAR